MKLTPREAYLCWRALTVTFPYDLGPNVRQIEVEALRVKLQPLARRAELSNPDRKD